MSAVRNTRKKACCYWGLKEFVYVRPAYIESTDSFVGEGRALRSGLRFMWNKMWSDKPIS